MEALRERGKKTALDDRPELDEEAKWMWELYSFVGASVVELDAYARWNGLPPDWNFKECLSLFFLLEGNRRKLAGPPSNDNVDT